MEPCAQDRGAEQTCRLASWSCVQRRPCANPPALLHELSGTKVHSQENLAKEGYGKYVMLFEKH